MVYQRCRGRETIKLSPLWRVFLIKSSFLTRSSHFHLNHLNSLERECCQGLNFWRHLLSSRQFSTVDLILRALRVIKNAPYPPSLESLSPASDAFNLSLIAQSISTIPISPEHLSNICPFLGGGGGGGGKLQLPHGGAERFTQKPQCSLKKCDKAPPWENTKLQMPYLKEISNKLIKTRKAPFANRS